MLPSDKLPRYDSGMDAGIHEIATIDEWLADGRSVVLATICRIVGSSSQPLGSRMAIADDGRFVGAVSGGCVESDVVRRAEAVRADGGARLAGYGPVTDPLIEIGLNCDGRIDVVLELLDARTREALVPPRGQRLVTRYRRVGDDRLRVEHRWEPVADDEEPWTRTGSDDEGDWTELVEPRVPPWLLLIVSAGPVAAPLATFARELGFRVVLSDPRERYARREHVPAADDVLCAWPRDLPAILGVGSGGIGPRCAVVSLNHEPRFEDDLFRMLMDQPPVAYLGAMGKRRRHEERLERQVREGYDLTRLPEVRTPIGLDLGGKDPASVALSIIAEIQAVRHGRTGGALHSGAAEGRVRRRARVETLAYRGTDSDSKEP